MVKMGFNNDNSKPSLRAIIIAFTILYFCYYFRYTFSSADAAFNIYLPSTSSQANPLHNVAAIIETRDLNPIAPLILHFSTVLGPSWPIHIFTLPTTPLPKSAPFLRALTTGAIQIRHLPAKTDFKVRDDVSAFLTAPWLWETLAPAPHILLFQADSILCANSPLRMEDFLELDFVGAPINTTLGLGDEGMNGGLSLRNRTMMLDIVNRWSWKDERAASSTPNFPNVAYEDQWFYKKMMGINDDWVRRKGHLLATGEETDGRWEMARLPTPEQAMRFSVETIWYDEPLGYHQIPSWQWDRVKEIDAWCPEHRMASSDKMRNAGE